MPKPWEIFFKMAKASSDPGDAQDHSGGTSDLSEDFDDEEADDDAAEEGDEEASEDGDLEGDESEEEGEEQGDDEDEESEGDEPQDDEPDADDKEEPAGSGEKSKSFKDDKTGNWDWKKIDSAAAKLGSPELSRVFQETQAHIGRVSQENSQLKQTVQHVPQLQERAKVAQYFDHLVQTDPAVRKAVFEAVQGPGPGQHGAGGGQDPFAGFNPNDPALPVLRQMHQENQAFRQRMQHQDQMAQRQQREGQFLQGLRSAKDQFKQLTGRDITEDQLNLVAQEMQKTNLLNGQVFVPSLFVKEIQDAATAKILNNRKVDRKIKNKLPKSAKSGRRAPKTQGKASKHQIFDEEWSKHMDE